MHFMSLLFISLTLAVAPIARGAMVTIRFTGYVTEFSLGEYNHLPPLSIGDPFSGSYTYDDSTQDEFGSITRLEYRIRGLSLKVVVGGREYELNPARAVDGVITATGRLPGYPVAEDYTDVYTVVASTLDGENSLFARLEVIGALDALPASLQLRDLSLPTLSSTRGRFGFSAPPPFVISPSRLEEVIGPNGIPIFVFLPAVYGGGSGFVGPLTSLTVPEPSDALLMALALGWIGLCASRCLAPRQTARENSSRGEARAD